MFGVVGLARETLHRELPELARGADRVVVDGPPRVASIARSALLAADLVLVPATPSPFDGWASAEMLGLIGEARVFRPELRARMLLTRREDPTMTTDHFPDDEPLHAESPTSSLLSELQLYGHRPFQDEPDPRPLPEEPVVRGALADIFDALVSTLQDTRLEPDLDDLLWSTVNLFHRATGRIERELDDNEQAQKRSQREQDGSEVKSVELERLLAEGLTLIERRNAFELMRDQAADLFEVHTGSMWRPHTNSMVNRRTLTAAMIDSRDFLAARRRAETEVMLPAGPKVAFTGGLDFNDHCAIWAALDKVHAKHPGMVLLHGGSPKGAERIAACWADNRRVVQIAFKPDWTRHAKAAPFKRNDQLLEVLPIGVIVFPGSGISDNLADKARKLGIPLFDFRKGGGA